MSLPFSLLIMHLLFPGAGDLDGSVKRRKNQGSDRNYIFSTFLSLVSKLPPLPGFIGGGRSGMGEGRCHSQFALCVTTDYQFILSGNVCLPGLTPSTNQDWTLHFQKLFLVPISCFPRNSLELNIPRCKQRIVNCYSQAFGDLTHSRNFIKAPPTQSLCWVQTFSRLFFFVCFFA